MNFARSRHKTEGVPPADSRIPYVTLTTTNKTRLTTLDKLKLWTLTLFYHTSFSLEYVVDTLMEPVFWFVDHFTHLLGPAFVVTVVVLVTGVVVIAHLVGLPFWLAKSPQFTILLIIVGYWAWLNLSFNFVQVARVSPGIPDDPDRLSLCTVTICKKCISPKPPRTHHCSICNRCYLNMDHHCPWVNNCVGHFNRRYFLLTMVYIVGGCCFIMLFGVELAYREVIMDEAILPDCSTAAKDISKSITPDIEGEEREWYYLTPLEHPKGCDEDTSVLWLGIKIKRQGLRYLIWLAGLLCIATSLALGGLTLWHARLITMGETSIEYHINKAERKKCDGEFVNMYDLGKIRNWQVLLGLDQPNTSFYRHILFPSSHRPTGTGYDWTHITEEARKRRRKAV